MHVFAGCNIIYRENIDSDILCNSDCNHYRYSIFSIVSNMEQVPLDKNTNIGEDNNDNAAVCCCR